MKRIVWFFIALLIVLHQDFWWWDDSETLWFGFLPVGLGYHALVSMAAAVLWALAVVYCWPGDLEDEVDATAIGGSTDEQST